MAKSLMDENLGGIKVYQENSVVYNKTGDLSMLRNQFSLGNIVHKELIIINEFQNMFQVLTQPAIFFHTGSSNAAKNSNLNSET